MSDFRCSIYSCRLAFLSEKRVQQDQSRVEDTLSLNRQSKVEEDFANFFDEARMDARETIQEFYKSKEEIDVNIHCPRLACLIFEVRHNVLTVFTLNLN